MTEYTHGLSSTVDELRLQLHAARYAYHCQIRHKYTVLKVLPKEEAAEHYRRSMDNYDKLIEESAHGYVTEANQLDMDKGIG